VILERNFPKLLGMKLLDPATGKPIIDPQTGKQRKAKASKALDALRGGTFEEAAHTVDQGRIRTLFWIPDVVTDPDGIYPNAHPVVAGDEVYVKRYAKDGSEVKLVVVGPADNGQRVIITSFLTSPKELENCISKPALWERQKK
jgi:hypothetical protein